MPIKTLHRQARQVGRIRLGTSTSATSRSGRAVRKPVKLDTFRLTTPSLVLAEAAAALLGGTAQEWVDAPTVGQWEVTTTSTQIPVVIPPGETSVSQWMELWTGGVCARRCDGITETLSGGPCLCPEEVDERRDEANQGRACKPTTRINVIIPGLPDIGVWRVDSHGFYAAVELGGAADFLTSAGARGIVVPAVLRLEQRETRTLDRGTGKPVVKKYPVPVLEIQWNLHQLAEVAAAPESGMRLALQGQATPAAIEAAPATARAVGGIPDGASPEDVAGLVDACGTVEDLYALGKEARARGYLPDATVQLPGDDAVHLLTEVFAARRDTLGTTVVPA